MEFDKDRNQGNNTTMAVKNKSHLSVGEPSRMQA